MVRKRKKTHQPIKKNSIKRVFGVIRNISSSFGGDDIIIVNAKGVRGFYNFSCLVSDWRKENKNPPSPGTEVVGYNVVYDQGSWKTSKLLMKEGVGNLAI